MSKSPPPYSALDRVSVMQEFPSQKCKYFFTGFITALSFILICGTAFQLYLYSYEPVNVSSGATRHNWPAPPPHEEVARVARYVVHISDWASISTISTADPIKGYPFGNIVSISDGPVIKSTGTPYVYITRMDLSGKDLLKDPRATFSLSEAQSDYCKTHDFDPQTPQCAHVQLTGTMQEVKNGTSEAEFARKALFSRHPDMASWPASHHWLFMKLNITHIYILDDFGGPIEVDVTEYYNTHL